MGLFNCRKDKPRPIVTAPSKPATGTGHITLGIVVGHNERAQGAINYLGESEWQFNKRVAHKLSAKLNELGIKSAIIFRPKSGGYSHEVRNVCQRLKELDVTHSLHLHFNAAQRSARGCEVLISAAAAAKPADLISDALNESLNIKERHNDGVHHIYKGHNGYVMLDRAAEHCISMLVEPCFGGYRTSESEAIFENEDKYVSILAEAISKF